MKKLNIYVLLAWYDENDTHPLVLTFTNRKKALKQAELSIKNFSYKEVIIRKDTFINGQEIPYFNCSFIYQYKK